MMIDSLKNGRPVSLGNLMHHGWKDMNRKHLPDGIRPNGKPMKWDRK